jgi:hypothetical protein
MVLDEGKRQNRESERQKQKHGESVRLTIPPLFLTAKPTTLARTVWTMCGYRRVWFWCRKRDNDTDK